MAVETIEQRVTLPEYQEQFLKNLLTDVRDVGTQPVTFPEIQVAGLTPVQRQAIERGVAGIGSFQPLLQTGSDILGMGVGALMPGASDAFMNPFVDQVIDRNLADITRQGDIARQQIASRAVQQGAFGGSRQAVADQELQRNLADTFARQSAGLRAQAFESAQERAQKASELFTKAGIATAGLGEAAQGANLRDIQLLSSLGGQEQRQQQAELDALRQTSLSQQFEPFQRLSFMSDILRGVPSQQTTLTTTTKPDPSRLSQIVGLGGGIASLLGAFGGGGGGTGILSGLGKLFSS
tara:strand:+ start:5388 stop:6272 length:885 start_codon:yes stop_codon:yes gene_type:complete